MVKKHTCHAWQKTKHKTAVWTVGDYDGFTGKLVLQLFDKSYMYENNELLWEICYVTEPNTVLTEAMGMFYSTIENLWQTKPMLWLDVTENRLDGSIQHIVDWCQSRDIKVGVKCLEKDHTKYKVDVWMVTPYRTPFMSGVMSYAPNVKFIEHKKIVRNV